jgi:hypothetical protein
VKTETARFISYRGGVVTFALPALWHEEYEPEGGGAFYPNRSDSGTLRLNVITLAPPHPGQAPLKPAALLARTATQHGTQPHALPSGNALLRFTTHAEEEGTPVTLHFWHLAGHSPPAPPRVAIFVFTVASALESSPLIQAELSFLERWLPEASFSPIGGADAV